MNHAARRAPALEKLVSSSLNALLYSLIALFAISPSHGDPRPNNPIARAMSHPASDTVQSGHILHPGAVGSLPAS